MKKTLLILSVLVLLAPAVADAAARKSARTTARTTAKTIDYNCSDFATHAQAQKFFIDSGGPAYDPYRLDGDKDGQACEDLP